jgi:hypothetical protein
MPNSSGGEGGRGEWWKKVVDKSGGRQWRKRVVDGEFQHSEVVVLHVGKQIIIVIHV